MILYFISALLISAVLFKLGSYFTIISIMATSGKAVAALLLVVGLVVVFRKLAVRSRHSYREQPHLIDKWLLDRVVGT